MLKSIAEDIRRQFHSGNKITQLIIINSAVFIAINLVRLGFTLMAGFEPTTEFHDIVKLLSLNADLLFDATHPWVIFTHMFLHLGFWHFLFNMLFLYWFGRIVGDFLGDQRVVPLYLLSGLFGALIYLLSAPLVHAGGSYAFGASASVMGFVMVAGLIAPEYNMRLLFIGDVKLKYIVLVLILLDLFGIAGLDNTGGRMAHLGGVAFGWIYVALLRQGKDLAAPVNRFADWVGNRLARRQRPVPRHKSSRIFLRHSSVSASRKRSEVTESGGRSGMQTQSRKTRASGTDMQVDQERLDAILDKIKDKGYDSLSAEEKEFLFLASKK